jgi:ribosome biogenesis GTPase
MTAAAGAGTLFGARVVATFGRHFLLRDGAGRLHEAVRRGKRGDVVIGDRVLCSRGAGQATIEQIEARRSLLHRADGVRVKALAANVDRVLLVFAPQPPFSEHFLWRALVAAQVAGLDTIAVLNKTDLADGLHRAQAAATALAALHCPTLAVSARQEPARTTAELGARLQGHDTLMIGQSGMGKSTLLNLLVPDAGARTQEYSRRLNLGRQTTTASRSFDLPGGGTLIDTPGFREFGLAHVTPAQLAAAMPDLAAHLGACRFGDCVHRDEPACAVRAAVERGAIDPARYAFYLELSRPRGAR